MSSPKTAAVSGAISFASLTWRGRITTRAVQIALGVIWVCVGLFQFKSFMYTHGLINEVFGEAMEHQPSWIAASMKTIDDFYGRDLTLWNTLAAQIQLAIGLGLILSRKTVKPALIASFGWALAVWWFGEGFGGLLSNTLPAPLMGAPGAVILYALIGLLVWPTGRRTGRSPGGMGPLRERGAQLAWAGLWLLGAFLWLVNVNRAQGATSEMIKGMAEASPHWLAKIQDWGVHHAQGHGTTIAIVLAALSAAIALGVFAPSPLRWAALALAIVISLAYWLFGQSLGGPFWAGGATDFNSGPLYVLLAIALFPIAQTSAQEAPESPPAVTTTQTRVSAA